MAISKADAKKLQEAELTLMEAVEKYVDGIITTKYNDNRDIPISIDICDIKKAIGGKELTHRLLDEIKRRYELPEYGWKVRIETASRDGAFIQFS